MSNNYKLLPNSKLVCVESGDEVCILRKGDQNTPDNVILRVPLDNYLKGIEEIPVEKRNKSKLVIVEECLYDCLRSHYRINTYRINTSKRDLNNNITSYYSTIEPKKISSKYYLCQDSKNKLCLVDADINVVYLIDPKLEEIVEITNPEINCFDTKNYPNIYELQFTTNDIERLHIFLKIDEEVKVHNIFYSEKEKGWPYTVYCPEDESDYLDIETFYNRLLNNNLIYKLMRETGIKEEHSQIAKKKIRKRATEMLSDNE